MDKFFGKIDKTIFWGSAIICLVFVLIASTNPAAVSKIFSVLFSFFIDNLGWTYLLAVSGFVIFCLFLAISKYGNIKLAKDDEKPEFSTAAWFAMLFAAGMGVGLVFWGVAEPIYHFAGAPLSESNTAAAASEAMRYTFFHWGLHAWAIYGVVALGLAYFQFRKGLPGLISSCFSPILGEEGIKGPIGKSIDTFTVVMALFGVATSLGLGAMQVTTGMNIVFSTPNTTTVSIVFVAIVTTLFTISAVTGINRGIKWLSNINMVAVAILMLVVLFLGPTRYILNFFTESLGQYIQNIVWMSFFVDTQGAVAEHTGYGWVGAWTVFYWAWWITWTPFVGSFIARISKGRTIREFIIGILVAPSLLSFIWFSIIGGTAIHEERFGAGGIAEATFADVTSAIFAMFNNLPATELLSLMAMFVVTIFFITSADSATLVVSMMTSGGDLEPKSGSRVFWGAIAGSIASMLILTGGLSSVQTIAFALAFPFTIIMVFIMYTLAKSLALEEASLNKLENSRSNTAKTHNM
ncbi:glycine betaine uptake BCCT transporter [Desulfitibacter alkalitolerans]|uniref:glycine betaine uptake BCCT transporter n=1 Tax=Desulfitibacter alkalitolerans TaxID=264641 RepID=UPI0006848CE9|nr:BCCT family transporter [Desulfitibacter alkalitolerans]